MNHSMANTEFLQRIARGTAQHPCYNAGAHKYARMHIPVAPACNIQCNYCNRKYDCANESRPGVTSGILTPEAALHRFKEVRRSMDNLKVVGIAGPGDALAEFDKTKEAINLIRAYDPDITVCLSTNGLLLPRYASQIVELGIGHVTVTINAVDPAIGKRIYDHIRYEGSMYKGWEAAAVLLENQLQGLRELAQCGVLCKVNIVMIKGMNDGHIEQIVRTVKRNGAYITNIMPLIPVPGTPFGNLPAPSHAEICALRKKCEKHIKQMYHCRQCRADAIGTLGHDRPYAVAGCKAH